MFKIVFWMDSLSAPRFHIRYVLCLQILCKKQIVQQNRDKYRYFR